MVSSFVRTDLPSVALSTFSTAGLFLKLPYGIAVKSFAILNPMAAGLITMLVAPRTYERYRDPFMFTTSILMPLTLIADSESTAAFALFPLWFQFVWYCFMPMLYGVTFFTPTWVTMTRMVSLSACIHYAMAQRNTLGQPPFLLSWFLSHLLMYGLTYLIHTKWSLPRYLALRHAAEARRKLVLAAAAEPRARARTQIAPHLTGKLFGVQCSDFTAAEMEAIVAAARKRCDALSRTAPLLEVSCFDGCVILLLQGITVAEASAEETEESAQSSFSLSADDLLEALPERLRQKITLARAGAAARQPAVETIDRLALPAWETTRVRVAFSGLEEAELHLWRPAVTSTARKSELQPLAFDWTYAAGTRTATLHCTLPPLPHLEVLHVGAKKIVAEAEAAAAGPDAAFLSSMRPLLVLGPDHLADLTAIARPGVAADIATYAGSLNAAFGRVPAGRRRDRVRITTASGLAALAAPAAATVAVLEGVPRGGRHLLSLFDGEILPALAGEKSWAWPQQGGAMGLSLQFEDPAMERLWLDTFVRDVSTPASRFFRVFFALSPFVNPKTVAYAVRNVLFFLPDLLMTAASLAGQEARFPVPFLWARTLVNTFNQLLLWPDVEVLLQQHSALSTSAPFLRTLILIGATAVALWHIRTPTRMNLLSASGTMIGWAVKLSRPENKGSLTAALSAVEKIGSCAMAILLTLGCAYVVEARDRSAFATRLMASRRDASPSPGARRESLDAPTKGAEFELKAEAWTDALHRTSVVKRTNGLAGLSVGMEGSSVDGTRVSA